MNDNPAAPTREESVTWIFIVRLLCLLAFGLSAYLLCGSLTGERLPGCGVESGCGAVLSSRWAYLFRIPVSLPALLLYAAVLAATIALKRRLSSERRQQVRGFLIAAATALVAAATWFVC